MSHRTKLATGTAMVFGMLAAMPAVAQTTAPRLPAATTTKPIKPLYRNVRSFYRNVRSFWGDVNPFYRNVRSFWGDVDPFYRNVRSFWGTMDPATMATVAGAPAYAGVGPFWEQTGYRWEGIASRWQTAGDYNLFTAFRYGLIADDLRDMVGSSKSFWGAAVTKQTGKTFEAGFSNAILAKHGINLNDASSLARLPANQQSEFFINWYDGLMAFSGTDHADWWMKATNWSPKLTQTMGGGAGSTLGLVDDYASKTVSVIGKVDDLTKKTGSLGGHGEGVLSLVVSAHDGKGVMGVAPGAKVIAYNPFDATGSADWAGVSAGIQAVAAKGATVINLSLGVPNATLAPDWQAIFTKSEINTHKDKTLYIIAAGNDGFTQTGNINMKGALDTTFIVVGSVGPTGISDFSNRPGTACVTDGAECKYSSSLKESGLLRNRFITAPGELILVSDGAGGLVRQSGTSLAAPMVAGAVALIQDRWPWMREKPRDIAMVILGSAKDMGAPGIDPVYGVGMLDIEAAMSPLNFTNLKFYLTNSSGGRSEVPVSTLRSNGVQASWVTNNMYFHAFEKLDQVERDFLIPLSSRLHGTTRGGEYFQDYVYNRMTGWLGTSRFTATGGGGLGFAEGTSSGALAAPGGWSMRMSGRLVSGYATQNNARRTLLHSTVDVQSPEGNLGFTFGHGDGAAALGGQAALGMASDFDPYVGGANPLLGFANGGGHVAARVGLGSAVTVQAGVSQQRQARGLDLYGITDPLDRVAIGGLARYQAGAANVRVDYRPTGWLAVSGSATRLHEPDAFLGFRSLARSDFAGGTTTDGVTLSANADLGAGVSLFGTTTNSRSTATGTAALGVERVTGTSYQLGIGKQSLIGKNDRLRLSVAQPLRLTGGSIALSQVQVVNRETGEQGLVTERFAIGGTGARRLVVEGLYGVPLLDGQAEVGLFGRGEIRDLDQGTPRLMLGSQFRLAL